MKAPANNVTRLLDAHKVPYTAFALPLEKLGAQETAQFLQVPVELVFKTIVIAREKAGKPILAVVPGDRKVDLKALAAAVGEKKLRLTSQNEAEQMTGLLTGGISPLALINKGFQVVLDDSALQSKQVYVSGGQRGLNIRMPVSALIDLTHAKTAPVSIETGAGNSSG